jgi:signal transduction histidine kinase
MAFGKFGKYYPDGGSYRAENFDLVRALRDAVEWFCQNDGQGHEVSFTTDTDRFMVTTDSQHLHFIIVNLLQNAAKYSDPGTAIDITLTTRHDVPVFRVRDQGIGVPEQELADLFSPFYRASNVGERPGTGMGLPIVKKSARFIGAEVSVDSRERVGTTFTITLPGRVGRPPA